MSNKFKWHELIDRHLHGELNQAEKERLAEWLDSDPAARKAFVEQVQWDTQFSEAFRERSSSLRGPITKQIADLISVEQTTTRGERRLKRVLTRSLLTAAGLAAAFLISFSLLIALIRSQKEVTGLKHELESARHDAATAGTDESAIIYFYAREHQELIARHASLSPTQPEPMQIRISQDDILYYEILEDEPEYVNPGIILRGPTSQRQINSSESTTMSNGRTLTLSEAQETTNFDLVAPPLLHPYYRLNQIRTIYGRDTMQMLYTNGINSISLFEQPLNGQRGLEPRDFREYAVYLNREQGGGTILAWRDTTLSYVLIGNINLSQLMDMAQSINVRK
jgi:hypothetical protein